MKIQSSRVTKTHKYQRVSYVMDPLIEKPERIAFIAYNIGIYESIQKFASLILSGKINVLIGSNPKSTIARIDTNEVDYVIHQLKACGVSLP